MEINGIAHVILTPGDFEASRAFYRRLLPFLGLIPLRDTDDYFYCIGGRTGLGIRRSNRSRDGERFDQARVGLHHLRLEMNHVPGHGHLDRLRAGGA